MNRRKRKVVRKTLLIVGEGMHEEFFLKHLKSIYEDTEEIRVKVQKANGGSALSVLGYASRISAGYDSVLVVIDNDRGETEARKASELAKRCNIELILNTPCLEATLLRILDHKLPKSGSVNHKNLFEEFYLPRSKRAFSSEYDRLFPKSTLEKQRKKIDSIERIIAKICDV